MFVTSTRAEVIWFQEETLAPVKATDEGIRPQLSWSDHQLRRRSGSDRGPAPEGSGRGLGPARTMAFNSPPKLLPVQRHSQPGRQHQVVVESSRRRKRRVIVAESRHPIEHLCNLRRER